jgi:hypothetical protein
VLSRGSNDVRASHPAVSSVLTCVMPQHAVIASRLHSEDQRSPVRDDCTGFFFMASNELPEDLKRLLTAHIESYEHLAILVFLYGERPRAFTSAALSDSLKISAGLVSAALASLQQAHLVRAPSASPPHYAYDDSNPALAASVEVLAREYAENPVRIIQLMSSNAIERVRTAALHAFADAFIFKKDPGDG